MVPSLVWAAQGGLDGDLKVWTSITPGCCLACDPSTAEF